jgi:hypothetical protein
LLCDQISEQRGCSELMNVTYGGERKPAYNLGCKMAGEAGVAVIAWLGSAILLFEPTRTPRCFNELQYPVSRAVASQWNELRDVRQCPKDAECHAPFARAQGPALEESVRKECAKTHLLAVH